MKHRRNKITAALAILTIAALSTTANAHTGHDTGASLLSGLCHPLTGLDHLLAMIAVGLWGGQLSIGWHGQRTSWWGRHSCLPKNSLHQELIVILLPLSFLAAMTLGAILSTTLNTTLAEQGILASLLTLGLLIALAIRLPTPLAAAIVALFAICHGQAHAAEMQQGGSTTTYYAGFLISTAALHLTGIALAKFFHSSKAQLLLRLSGGAVATTALLLWIGAQ